MENQYLFQEKAPEEFQLPMQNSDFNGVQRNGQRQFDRRVMFPNQYQG